MKSDLSEHNPYAAGVGRSRRRQRKRRIALGLLSVVNAVVIIFIPVYFEPDSKP